MTGHDRPEYPLHHTENMHFKVLRLLESNLTPAGMAEKAALTGRFLQRKMLVAVYAKAKFDNMPVEVLKSWKEAYDA